MLSILELWHSRMLCDGQISINQMPSHSLRACERLVGPFARSRSEEGEGASGREWRPRP